MYVYEDTLFCICSLGFARFESERQRETERAAAEAKPGVLSRPSGNFLYCNWEFLTTLLERLTEFIILK